MSTIDQYVSINIQPAIGFDPMSIYVFSYFYNIMSGDGLLLNENDVTKIPIPVIKQTAKNTSPSGLDASAKHPFLCFDLTYIYSLSTKGYGSSEVIQIQIYEKIQQFEVAWSLDLVLK